MDEKTVYLTVKETVLKHMDTSRELSDEELMSCIRKELTRMDKVLLLPFQKRKQYAEAVFHSFRKYGVLQELIEDEAVTEILVNGPYAIFFEKKGELYRYDKTFSGEIGRASCRERV